MNELKPNMMEKSLTQASSISFAQGQQVDQSRKTSGNSLPEVVVEQPAMNEENVVEAVSRINQYVQQTERTLDFQLDESSGKTIISVYDKESSELIHQIPSELALELAQKLNDEEPSLLFSAQV